MNSFLKFLCFVFVIFLPQQAVSDTHVEIPIISSGDLDILPADFKKRSLFRSKQTISSYWAEKPDIRLCTNSGVTDQRLEKAVKFWERLGYEFGRIYIDKDSISCFNGGKNNEIVIMLVNSSVEMGDNLAVTKTYYISATYEIVKSQIYIHKFAASKERVLEHEIGHALGWVHFNQKYHLMHSHYNSGGHTTSGLKISVYKSLLAEIIGSLR